MFAGKLVVFGLVANGRLHATNRAGTDYAGYHASPGRYANSDH